MKDNLNCHPHFSSILLLFYEELVTYFILSAPAQAGAYTLYMPNLLQIH